MLDPETSDGIRSGTIWCWTNARWVTFVYSPTGDAGSVRRFLGENLARTVQCDGTNITTFIERAGGKRPGCWAHGRRRLVEAARSGDQIALEGLRIIGRLFAVERISTLAGDNADQRRARRQQHTRPVLEELRAWVDTQRAVIERTADVLSIVATCIAHDVNPRAYLHVVTKLIVQGWPKAKLRDLLPDRMLASHPEIYVGEPLALSTPAAPASLGA